MDLLKPALNILHAYNCTPETNLKLLLSQYLEREKTASHPGVSRLVYGVTRKQRLLDYLLDTLSHRKTAVMEPEIRERLRAGIYLMLFSDSYPDYAVVNEAVSGAPERAKSFINAILRKCGREKKKLSHLAETVADPSIRFSMVPELLEHLKQLPGDLYQHLAYFDREPAFHLLTAPGTLNPDQWEALAGNSGLTFRRIPTLPCLELQGSVSALRKKIREGALIYFQNTASQLICAVVAHFSAQFPARLLDCCSAPGTKAVTLALLNRNLRIIAADINHRRLLLAKELFQKFAPGRISAATADATQPSFQPVFDFVLLDAPCTSAGTVRKNPDLKLKITPELIRANALRQKEILIQTARRYSTYVKSGNPFYLLYSVCSFIRDETDDVMAALLEDIETSSFPRFQPVNISPLLSSLGFNFYQGRHGAFLLPNDNLNNDLFYISLLRLDP